MISCMGECGSRGSSVCILSDYWLDDRAIGVRSPTEAKDFSCNPCVQISSGAHLASFPMGTGGPFSRGKGRDVDHSPHLLLRSIICRSYISSPPSASIVCSGTAFILIFTIKCTYRRICMSKKQETFAIDKLQKNISVITAVWMRIGLCITYHDHGSIKHTTFELFF
jgi:hypothetical protein